MKRLLGMPDRVLEFLRAPPLQASLILWIALFVAVGIKNLVYPDIHNVYPCYEARRGPGWPEMMLYDLDTTGFIYRYGPAFAFSMTPLAMLPSALGSLLWNWLNFGLFFYTMWKLVHGSLPGNWTARHKALFSTWSCWEQLERFGADSVTCWSSRSLPWPRWPFRTRRWWWAAFLLAIPVHIKVWPLVPALLLIAYWPKKLALRFPAAMLAVAAAPLLTKPWDWVWRQYVGWYDLLVGPCKSATPIGTSGRFGKSFTSRSTRRRTCSCSFSQARPSSAFVCGKSAAVCRSSDDCSSSSSHGPSGR